MIVAQSCTEPGLQGPDISTKTVNNSPMLWITGVPQEATAGVA